MQAGEVFSGTSSYVQKALIPLSCLSVCFFCVY